jgi:virginiamycin B lyase
MRFFLLAAWMPAFALAGGSNYGVAPGSRDIAGKITEWAVPTPRFARDPAPGPDGNIYIAVMQGNRIARFDTRAKSFKEWDLPRAHGRTASCGEGQSSSIPAMATARSASSIRERRS